LPPFGEEFRDPGGHLSRGPWRLLAELGEVRKLQVGMAVDQGWGEYPPLKLDHT